MLPVLCVVVPEQVLVRVEEHAERLVGPGDPHGQVRRLEARPDMALGGSLAGPAQQAHLAAGDEAGAGLGLGEGERL